MSDLPDYIALAATSDDILAHFAEYQHRLLLVPPGMTVRDVLGRPNCMAVFLVDAGCTGEVLDGAALPAYLNERAPVLVLARRARDLRPILRRADGFARRGYRVEVLAATGLVP